MRAVAATLFLAAAVSASQADDAADAAKKLEGTYEVLGVTVGGKADDSKKAEVQSFVIKDGKITIKTGTRDEVASFTLDPSKKPGHIDLVPDGKADRAMAGIYEAKESDKGLELTITFARGGAAARPKDFSGAGNAIVVKLLRPKPR